MRVALAQVDGKWPNLALAKLAAWHKSLGDDVQWFNAMFEYDIVLDKHEVVGSIPTSPTIRS